MAKSNSLESSKKDMNFFSEFSSSSKQVGSYLSLILIVFLGLFVIGGAIYGVVFLQTSEIRNNINKLNEKMQSESYQSELARYTEIQISMSELNQQYYDISSLFVKVSNLDKVGTKYMDTIYSNLPLDTVITQITYADDTITLTGKADSYYSPLDMISNFTKAKLFSYVEITKLQQADISQISVEELPFTKKYDFEVKGSLKSSYSVLISRLVDDSEATPLTAISSQKLDVGTQYSESGINTYTLADGTVYTLSRVMINNAVIADAQKTAILQSDTITGLVTSAVDIKLFYMLSSANGGVQG